MEDSNAKKRTRDEAEGSPENDVDSPEVKRLRENLLDSLDDEAECCTDCQDLDSYVRSFEEEIRSSPSPTDVPASDSGEQQTDLGYLLVASDDELGLPPTTSSSPDVAAELVRAESESSELAGEFWGFEGEVPKDDPFELGAGIFDGLFEYSDYGSGDFFWRSETLPAQ